VAPPRKRKFGRLPFRHSGPERIRPLHPLIAPGSGASSSMYGKFGSLAAAAAFFPTPACLFPRGFSNRAMRDRVNHQLGSFRAWSAAGIGGPQALLFPPGTAASSGYLRCFLEGVASRITEGASAGWKRLLLPVPADAVPGDVGVQQGQSSPIGGVTRQDGSGTFFSRPGTGGSSRGSALRAQVGGRQSALCCSPGLGASPPI